MRIQIFNVEHGFCAYIVADNGNTMLVDCGHNATTGFYPSDYLVSEGCTQIERFFPLNYDEDHLSGLPRLRERIPIQILHRNLSLTSSQVRTIKRQGGPLGPGITALLEMLDSFTGTVTSPPLYPNLEYAVFHNDYPEFSETNNLSLVLFLHGPGLSVVFPGDLEKAGWLKLLENASFREHLGRVNVFVASHHGRESGYAAEVFQHCWPDIVIISDEAIHYQTQEQSYRQHARGITWNQTETRRVLTTRKDGMLTIMQRSSSYHIQSSP